MLREEMPEIVALGKMKQLAGQFTKGLTAARSFVRRFIIRIRLRKFSTISLSILKL
jgi:hypothetical protein